MAVNVNKPRQLGAGVNFRMGNNHVWGTHQDAE